MKVSSKLLNITTLINTASSFGQQNYKICLMTSYGAIIGTLHELEENHSENLQNINSLKDFLSYTKENQLNLLDHIPTIKNLTLDNNDDFELIGDGSLLTLNDVKIFRTEFGKNTINLNKCYVHAEDVVGFFLVPDDEDLL